MRNRACCSAFARGQFFGISKLADGAMSCSNGPSWVGWASLTGVWHTQRESCGLLSSGEPSNEVGLHAAARVVGSGRL